MSGAAVDTSVALEAVSTVAVRSIIASLSAIACPSTVPSSGIVADPRTVVGAVGSAEDFDAEKLTCFMSCPLRQSTFVVKIADRDYGRCSYAS